MSKLSHNEPQLFVQGSSVARPGKLTNQFVADKNNLLNVLQNPVLCSAFHKFMISNYAEENLLLWLEVEKYKTMFNSMSPQKRLSEMKEIYEKFFTENSPFEVNVEYAVKNDLVAFMKDPQSGEINLFEGAQISIFVCTNRLKFKTNLVEIDVGRIVSCISQERNILSCGVLSAYHETKNFIVPACQRTRSPSNEFGTSAICRYSTCGNEHVVRGNCIDQHQHN